MFRIFSRLGYGEVSDRPIPTACTSGDVPTAGDVPTESGVPAASDKPAASSTPDTSSYPIGAEILVQGVDPITAE